MAETTMRELLEVRLKMLRYEVEILEAEIETIKVKEARAAKKAAKEKENGKATGSI